LHVVTISLGPFFAGDLIGFTTGLLITVLLLVLTLRAAKLPGTPLANIGFALCAMVWCAGGLFHTALVASGMASDTPMALAAQAVEFSGAASFPIPVLAIWRPFVDGARRKTAARAVRIAAWVFAGSVTALAWSRPLLGFSWRPLVSLHNFSAFT